MLDMKRNVVLLAACPALMMTANVLLITTSALVGQRLATAQGADYAKGIEVGGHRLTPSGVMR